PRRERAHADGAARRDRRAGAARDQRGRVSRRGAQAAAAKGEGARRCEAAAAAAARSEPSAHGGEGWGWLSPDLWRRDGLPAPTPRASRDAPRLALSVSVVLF